MPWHVAKSGQCPASKPWAVFKDSDDSLVGCHPSKGAAEKQVAALYANEKGLDMADLAPPLVPPKDELVRALYPALELRAADDAGMPTLAGHFAVFNQWTEIDSIWEGRFLERIAPGSFSKTFKENRDRMRVTFQHGKDPQAGDKPLGPIEELEEDDTGAFYAVPLLDTSYNRDLLPGLQANLYGSSFRFRVMKEELEQKPRKAAHNPEALPERTIKEAQVFEFGPVTYPAYAGATAGVRSMTDDYILSTFLREPERLRVLVQSMRDTDPALPDVEVEAEPHSDAGSRVVLPPRPIRFKSREDYLTWLTSQTSPTSAR